MALVTLSSISKDDEYPLGKLGIGDYAEILEGDYEGDIILVVDNMKAPYGQGLAYMLRSGKYLNAGYLDLKVRLIDLGQEVITIGD